MRKITYLSGVAVLMITSLSARTSFTAKGTEPTERVAVQIQLFPNAKKDKIELTTTTELKKVEIRSKEGKELKVIYNPKHIEIIDFSEYGKGDYFIEITTKDNAVITRTIVKE